MRQPDRRPILITDPHSGERQVILYSPADLMARLTPDQRDAIGAGHTIQSGPLLYTDLLAAFDARNRDAVTTVADWNARCAMTDFLALGDRS